MNEDTFQGGSGSGNTNEQNQWSQQPQVYPPQNFQENQDVIGTTQPPPRPASIVYRPNNEKNTDNGSGRAKGRLGKILKLFTVFIVILIVILSVFAFFLLGRSNENTNKEATLTYWGLFEDENVMRPIISEFEKENPNIKINYEKQELTDYREKLTVRTANGNGPDIFRYHPSWFPMISGILLPLPKETIEKNVFNDSYYDVFKRDLIKDGAIYGLPLYTDTLSLFINTSIFEQVATESGSEVPIPKTWQEFIDSSARLTKRDTEGAISIGGAGIGTYDNVTHAPDIISLLLAQNGVDLSNPGAYQEKIADAIRFYTNFSQVEDNVWDGTQDFTQLSFAQGKLAMYFGYYWDLITFKNSSPGLQFKIVPVPQLVSDEKYNIASYWVEGVNAETTNPKEALLFMKFLARADTQEKLFAEQAKTRQFGAPYSIKSFAEKLKDTELSVFVEQSNTAVSSPFVGGAPDNGLNDKQNNNLKETVNKVLAGESEESGSQTLLDLSTQTIGEFNSVIEN